MKISKYLKKTSVVIILMLISASSLIFTINNIIDLPLDSTIVGEQELIIELLASYLLIDTPSQLNQELLVIYLSWTLSVLISSIILADPKKVVFRIGTIMFFICFFLFVFGFRHSPIYFNQNFSGMFIQVLLLISYLVLLSIIFSLLTQKISERYKSSDMKDEKIETLVKNNRTTCPHCGTKYESVPLYCYNCSKKIKIKNEEI
jgi:hypothetical protein